VPIKYLGKGHNQQPETAIVSRKREEELQQIALKVACQGSCRQVLSRWRRWGIPVGRSDGRQGSAEIIDDLSFLLVVGLGAVVHHDVHHILPISRTQAAPRNEVGWMAFQTDSDRDIVAGSWWQVRSRLGSRSHREAHNPDHHRR
jgi:hypothetical protein